MHSVYVPIGSYATVPISCSYNVSEAHQLPVVFTAPACQCCSPLQCHRTQWQGYTPSLTVNPPLVLHLPEHHLGSIFRYKGKLLIGQRSHLKILARIPGLPAAIAIF